ncbi:MAG: hypothetical protein ABSG32_17035 [Terriglobia bacterium]
MTRDKQNPNDEGSGYATAGAAMMTSGINQASRILGSGGRATANDTSTELWRTADLSTKIEARRRIQENVKMKVDPEDLLKTNGE